MLKLRLLLALTQLVVEYISFAVSPVKSFYDYVTQLVNDTAPQQVIEALTSVKVYLIQLVIASATSIIPYILFTVRLEGNVQNLTKQLGDLTALSPQFTQPGDLAREIRDVIHEAEDAIFIYSAKTRRHKLRNWWRKALYAINHTLDLLSMAKKIKGITEKVRQKNEQGPGREELHNTASAGEREQQTSDEDDDVVGMEDEVKNFIGLLTKGTKDLEVISIIGMVGLGKTTLARKVFKLPTIERQFSIRAFVHVSQEYTREKVFQKILGQITDVTVQMNEMEDEDPAKEIRKHLQDAQYLIVLDDVWEPEDWDKLQIAFPRNENGSRILITSRNKSVALAANINSDHHILPFLRLEDAKKLLRKKVFGRKSPPDFVKNYEEEILKKCKGLPLAIALVAGTLLNKRGERYWWEMVSEGEADYDTKWKKKTDEAIKLSFDRLPDRYKPCFLYLGVFREDFEIPARTLYQLWVSEGFIELKQKKSLEDAAEKCLEELVGRSLVMVGKRRFDGHIKTCRIHDILRDFCKDMAEKEIFYRQIKGYEQKTDSIQSFSIVNDRRLCIHSNVGQYIKQKLSGRVSSFLSFSEETISLNPQDIQSIFAELKVLRVLHIGSIKFDQFPLALFSLDLLKYIAISGAFDILPQDMSNLCNLQTLIVSTSSLTLEIKWDIWKNMPQFRHLDTNSCTTLAQETNESSSPNSNLQTLSTISPESCKKEAFARTPNLKKLGIKGKLAEYFATECQCSLFSSFQELELLENLKVVNEDSEGLKALPDHKNFPRNLKSLTLSKTSLDWKHMETLGNLKKLEKLKLLDNAFCGESWQTKDGGFVRLEVFHIGETNLRDWNASSNSFPALSHLYLKDCGELTSIPADFVNRQSLRIIDLGGTRPEVLSRASEI